MTIALNDKVDMVSRTFLDKMDSNNKSFLEKIDANNKSYADRLDDFRTYKDNAQGKVAGLGMGGSIFLGALTFCSFMVTIIVFIRK